MGIMNTETHEFINDVSALGYDLGLPKSAAKVLGYLLVCEPRAQTAKDIAVILRMTPGSVMSALDHLKHLDFVRTRRRKGEILYEFEENSWITALHNRLSSVSRIVEQAEAGMQLFPDNQRLQVMHRVYTAYDKETKRILDTVLGTNQ